MIKVNVFDFDGTIYDGDSTVDFLIYILCRNIRAWKSLPEIIWKTIQYKLGRVSLNAYKEKFYSFIKYIDSLDDEVDRFWQIKQKKIKHWYIEMKKNTDVIISASPQWLLEPIAKRLEVELIASLVDPKTGKLLSENCKGQEKVRRFASIYGKECIDKFYSDSKSDLPMAKLAKEAYIVKGNKIIFLRMD